MPMGRAWPGVGVRAGRIGRGWGYLCVFTQDPETSGPRLHVLGAHPEASLHGSDGYGAASCLYQRLVGYTVPPR